MRIGLDNRFISNNPDNKKALFNYGKKEGGVLNRKLLGETIIEQKQTARYLASRLLVSALFATPLLVNKNLDSVQKLVVFFSTAGPALIGMEIADMRKAHDAERLRQATGRTSFNDSIGESISRFNRELGNTDQESVVKNALKSLKKNSEVTVYGDELTGSKELQMRAHFKKLDSNNQNWVVFKKQDGQYDMQPFARLDKNEVCYTGEGFAEQRTSIASVFAVISYKKE